MFGVAVTEFEDAVEAKAAAEELRKRAADAHARLQEVTSLVAQLSAKIAEK
jgi:hypothetical protein